MTCFGRPGEGRARPVMIKQGVTGQDEADQQAGLGEHEARRRRAAPTPARSRLDDGARDRATGSGRWWVMKLQSSVAQRSAVT